jgi:hypothetical protein
MKESDMELLQKELDELAAKWNLKNAAFCASDSEEHFVGTHVGTSTVVSFWETALNVGRLWQHIRTHVRKILNEYDANKGW